MENDWLKLIALLMPYASAKQQEMQAAHRRFVHYTSAEALMKILQSECVWMRKSETMNDFSEVEYGMQRVAAAYGSPTGERLRKLLNNIFPDFNIGFESLYNG